MGDVIVPTYNDLGTVYAGGDQAENRFVSIKDAFIREFGVEPELYTRAPGRVNLIGEHIDYEGYSVLPMAIKQDTVVAVRLAGSSLDIANLQSSKYPRMQFSTDPKQEVNTGKHAWANYFVSAYKGVFEYLERKGVAVPQPAGLQVLVHGMVPTGSGLSSSAAIVCASSLAILAAHGLSLTKAEVAEFACLAERYVGVTSGGMDQAISMMGMPGVAKLVEFNPVRATDVQLPPGATFVIGNSLTVSNKAETADKRYNLRVVECRLAAALLAKGLGAGQDKVLAIKTLQEVEPLIAAAHGPGEEGKAAAVKAHLHEGAYSNAEVAGLLGTPLEALYEGQAASLRSIAAAGTDGFKLRDRALHVYSEAARVTSFKATCDDASLGGEAKLAALGALMDASHASCSGLFQCSCAELDELVAAARAAGALGSRLTGAGWGGCTVSLVREAEVDSFIAALKKSYYSKRIAEGLASEAGMSEVLFASPPSIGAAVLKLQQVAAPALVAA